MGTTAVRSSRNAGVVAVVVMLASTCSGAPRPTATGTSLGSTTSSTSAVATSAGVTNATSTTRVQITMTTAMSGPAPSTADSSVASTSAGFPASAQTVAGVGRFAYHVISAFDSIWILAKNSATVTRLDATTGALLATITLDPTQIGGSLNRLAAGTDAVYVSALPLIRIDPATNQTTAITDDTPAAAVIAEGDTVWTASYPRGPIQRIEPDGTITTLDLPAAPWMDLAISHGLLWAVSQHRGGSRLIAFNGTTGDIVHDIPVALGISGYPVRLVADEHDVVIGVDTSGGSRTGSLVILDPATASITTTIELPARPEGIALTDHHIWTSGAVVDRGTLEVTPIVLGFSIARGPDGTIWATTPGADGDSTATRYTPGQFAG